MVIISKYFFNVGPPKEDIFLTTIYVTSGWINGTTSGPNSVFRCNLDEESNFFSGILCFFDNFQDLPIKSKIEIIHMCENSIFKKCTKIFKYKIIHVFNC